MKKIKYTLLFIISFHIFVSVLINIASLSILNTKKYVKFNNSAASILKNMKRLNIPFYIKAYSNIAGIDRGYGYYSPNISSNKLNISVVDLKTNKPLNIISSTFESKLKYNTMLTNLHVFTTHYQDRRLIVNSFSEYIFYKQQNINNIAINVNIFKINSLQDYEKSKVLFTKENIDSYIINRKK